MDDKVFNLLEKMYVELTEFKQETAGRFDQLATEVRKTSLLIEQEIQPDIKCALQGYHDVCEKLTTLEEKLDTLSEKVDRHDIKIQVIEGGKRA